MDSSPLYKKTLILVGLVIGVGCFMAGLITGNALVPHRPITSSATQLRENSLNDKGFKYINPLLGCGVPGGSASTDFTRLHKALSTLIAQRQKSGDVAKVSVYFDTRDGRWTAIDPNEQYYPASMLKVPTMIAYLKAAEDDPAILQKKLTYTQGQNNLNAVQYYKPERTLTPGMSYTVDELLERLIGFSDNNVVPLLVSNIKNSELIQVYNDLGIKLPSQTNEDFMTIGTYSNFFRVLYNGTYLSWNMSEKAMELLAEHDFPMGIEAGIPTRSIKTAQKFGEIDLSSNPSTPPGEIKELHDCGIVYYPEHPYMLCVMTKGTNFDKLADVIRAISARTYAEMSDVYPVSFSTSTP